MTMKKLTLAAVAAMAIAGGAPAVSEAAEDAPYEKIFLEPAKSGKYPRLWDKEALFAVPKATPADDIKFDFNYADNVKPIYLETIDYQGKPCRFFAWLGMPEGASADHKVPGVVLVHGGGGTAFAQWVEDWIARGYAVMAMDTVGMQPTLRFEAQSCRKGLEGGGPNRHNFEVDLANPKDSWTAHAVATVIKSHSYLRSLPEVDAKHIGITGISWGGYLTCITTAVDDRFVAAVPVYGCGFLGEFVGTVAGATREWLELFDPCMFLKSVKCPILFANRPVDPPYNWPQWVHSSTLPKNASRSCRLGFGHSHSEGRVPEAPIFMDIYCKGAPKLPQLSEQKVKDGIVSAEFKAYAPIERAAICWTEDDDSVPSPQKKWQQAPAGILDDTISAPVPPKATAFYLNLFDLRGAVVSTAGQGWK